MDSKGDQRASTSILLLITFFGVVIFLIAATFFPLKDIILSRIYTKPPSQAAVLETQNPTNSKVFEENWIDRSSIIENWQILVEDCTRGISHNVIDCAEFRAVNKNSFLGSKNLILSGGFTAKKSTLVEIGIQSEGQVLGSLLSQSGFIDAQTLKKGTTSGLSADRIGEAKEEALNTFKIVYAADETGLNYIYYYLNGQSTPLQKVEVLGVEHLNVFVSCKGKCTLDKLMFAGSPN